MARRAHRHRDRPARDPNLERLLDRDDIGRRAVGNPHDLDALRRIRRCLHARSIGQPGCRRSGPTNPPSRLAAVRVLVVGSGAREHALAWRLAQSAGLTELHAAPGNPGIATLGRCHPVRADDADGLLGLAGTIDADLVVIGPEGPLVAGVADVLRRNGVAVFGPSAAAARIEGSKTFAKEILQAAGVPTAATLAVARAPCVVKADGLASGKGVFVCHTAEELDAALRAVRSFGNEIVIEELLEGEEVSLFALSDGQPARLARRRAGLQANRRRRHRPEHGWHGRVRAGALARRSREPRRADSPAGDRRARTARGTVRRLPVRRPDPHRRRAEGPGVQCALRRSGDPGSDAAARGRPARRTGRRRARRPLRPLASARRATRRSRSSSPRPITPTRSDYAGIAIDGLAEAEATGALVFHSGTAARNGRVVTNGGRILSVTAVGPTLE